jgi:NAD(P)-dependent dehydrogenase (short-subunit alcohol dehydrogenase family)
VTLDFSGKTVLVTGGSRGIGAAISLAFARSGASVVINHLPTAPDTEGYEAVRAQIEDCGGECLSAPGDITDSAFCDDMCRTAVERFGSLDVLVNSAGFIKPMAASETSDEIWRAGIAVNLSGAFFVARAALSHMLPAGAGRILFIGSAGAITGGGGSAFYSAAKAGINGLVRSMSKEVAPKGVTVNAVLPALIETDILRERYSDPEKRKGLLERIPVGRIGQPEDVANLVLFLASEQASYICGQQIIVDGGSTYK